MLHAYFDPNTGEFIEFFAPPPHVADPLERAEKELEQEQEERIFITKNLLELKLRKRNRIVYVPV